MNQQPGPWLKIGVTLGALAGLWGSPAAAVTVADFGHANMKVEGVEARGARPLVTILTEFDESPAFAHDRAYFDNLVYNTLQHSVNGYFITNSNARFFWGRAGEGTIGPLRFTADEGKLLEPQRLIRMKEVAMESGFDFAQFDENGDGRVKSDELGILFIDNLGEHGGAKRSTAPVQAGGSTVSLDADVASAGHRASLMTIVHELSHLLGTVDLYGACICLSGRLTLMGPTGFGGDDERFTFHLDPWHKMQLGWIEPRIRSMRSSGSELLPPANRIEADTALILYDPARGVDEFFMLEYRTKDRPGLGYDEDVASTGLVIWHVKQDENKRLMIIPSLTPTGIDASLFAEGAPDLKRGGNVAWGSGAVTPPLRWLDGSSTKVRVQSRAFAMTNDSITVDWCACLY